MRAISTGYVEGDGIDICVLNPYFIPYRGGTEKVLYEVYKRISKKHNITIITSAVSAFGAHGSGRPLQHTEYIDDIKVVRIKTKQISIPFSPLPLQLFPALQSHIQSVNADLYHVNNRYQYFPSTIRTVRDMGAKLAITIHNSTPKGISVADDYFGLLYDMAIGRKFMHASSAITAVSKNALESTVQPEDIWKSKVIYNGVDHKLFRKISSRDGTVSSLKEKFGKGSTLILSNGRLTQQKGQAYLIRAVAELIKEGNDVRLLIIGKGPMYNWLYKYASRLKIADRFEIISGIPEEEIPYYYNASDLFVLPSLYEPAGMALIEAMACGVPSIATRVGGMPEMGQDTVSYSKPRDYASIKEAIINCLSDSKNARDRATRAISLVKKRNDWDIIAKEYEDCFLKASSQ